MWMTYRFALERADYTDLSAGRVLQSLPGHPAFPVRLATEIFQRCAAILNATAPYRVYDPCCGGGYLLTVIGSLHKAQISTLYGSDIDPDALHLAERNLALLTRAGLTQRIAQISEMLAQYGKPSHADALESAKRLSTAVEDRDLATHLFAADATSIEEVTRNLQATRIDLVITDLPYGKQSVWQTDHPTQPESWHLLVALRPILTENAVVAICANKQQKIAHEGYRRAEHFQVGKRRIVILQPNRLALK
jgi:hypothetical protein